MAFIPWPNGIQVCFNFVTAGQKWQFCLALQKDGGPPSTTDLQDVADGAAGWWTTSLSPNIENGTTLNETRATDMTAEGAPQRFTNVATPGLIAGSPMPLGTPLVMSFHTDQRGRSFRGRAYVSGSPASAVVSEVLADGTQVSNLVAAFATLLAFYQGIGFTPVVASQFHNKSARTSAVMTPILAVSADTAWDSQRRRLSGRGT